MLQTLDDLPIELARKRILGTRQAAAYVGVSLRQWEQMRAAGGTPPAVQITAKKLGYTVESLIAWIAARTQSHDRPAA